MSKIKRKRQSSSDSSSEDESLMNLSKLKCCDKLARQYGIDPKNLLFESTSVVCDLCDRLFTNRIGALVHNTKHIIIPLIRFKTLGEFYQCHAEELKQHTQGKEHQNKEKAISYIEDKLPDNEDVIHHNGDIICHKEDMMRPKEEMIQPKEDMIRPKEDMIRPKEGMICDREEYILPDSYSPESPINNTISNEKMIDIRSRIVFEDDDDDETINISDDDDLVLNKITSDCKVNLGEPLPLNKIVLGKANTQKSNMKVQETVTPQKSNMKVQEILTSQKSNKKVLETLSQKANLKVLHTLTSDCKVVLSEALPFSLTDIVTNVKDCNKMKSNSNLNSVTSNCKVNFEPFSFDEEILCDNEPFDATIESLRLDLALELESIGVKLEEEKVNTDVQTFEISDDDEVNGDEDVHNGDEEEDFESVHYDELSVPSFHKCKFCWHTFPNRFDLLRHSASHLRLLAPPPRRCLLCRAPALAADRKLPLCSACLLRVSRGRAHGVVECALCQSRLLTAADLETHLKAYHNEKGKLYSGIWTMCEVCAVFADKRNNNKCGTGNLLRFTHVGDLKEVGARRRCDQCQSKCFIAKLYQKSRPLAPSLSHSTVEWLEPARKLRFAEPNRSFNRNRPVKSRSKSNAHRLKNIRQRLKIMKMV